MTVKEIIKVICEKKGISTYDLAEHLNIAQSSVVHTVSRNDGMSMKVENLVRWLGELDYQITIQPMFEDGEDLILDGESDF